MTDDLAESTRAALSQDVIVDAALRLTADEPNAPLTLARLGAELGADPTAVYRHFRNRDELLLSVIDRVYGEGTAGYVPSDDWRAALPELAHSLRQAMLRRPSLSAEVGSRFTNGPNEREGIAELIRLFGLIGFDEAGAKSHARAFGELLIAIATASAAGMVRGDDAIEHDMRTARAIYGDAVGTDMAAFDAAAFATIIDTLMAGYDAMQALARRDHHDTNHGGSS
jgi:AcrR family transcriptional regulator